MVPNGLPLVLRECTDLSSDSVARSVAGIAAVSEAVLLLFRKERIQENNLLVQILGQIDSGKMLSESPALFSIFFSHAMREDDVFGNLKALQVYLEQQLHAVSRVLVIATTVEEATDPWDRKREVGIVNAICSVKNFVFK